jgi:hypothetical protein
MLSLALLLSLVNHKEEGKKTVDKQKNISVTRVQGTGHPICSIQRHTDR